MLRVRTGRESVNQSQPCWALPHQAEGSNTEIRSSAHEQDVSTLTGTKKGYKSGNTNEDTATVAIPLGHGPSASNRAMTILHSITSDLPTTWISGISCTISRSCTVKISHTVPCHARWDFGQLVNTLGSQRCLDPEASSLQVTDSTTTTPLANRQCS